MKQILLLPFFRSGKFFVLVLTIIIFLAGSCSTTDKKVIKLAHALDTSHPVHEAMEFMARRVKEKSNGHLEISIYPSQQLGTERECLELLQIGIVGITKVSAAVMEGIVPEFKVLSLPYIFRSKEHYFKVLDSEVGEELLLAGEEYWLHGLCYYDAGSRSFYSRDKLINKPEDLAGMKIRVMQSNTAIRMIKYLGGSATPISWGELYTALQGGVVDAAENNPPSFYLSRHYEVCKYYAINEHASIPDILVIGTRLWNSLDENERKVIKEAAIESAKYQRKLWKESEQKALEELQNAGVEIVYPDKEPFMKKVVPMYQNYKDDTKIYSLINRIRNGN
jgi:tripartite ATP-independent transporter DctP family solute receptor